MKNNKGFSLVELLAVVAILGILTGLAIAAYSRYTQHARDKAYETLQKSTINATEEYLMDHPEATEVTIEELVEGEYLERTADPVDNSKTCRGKISIIQNENEGALDTNDYLINLCCTNYNHTYKSETGEDIEDKRCKVDPYNLDDVPTIKVLNIYPAAGGNKLKDWMNSYGKGKINVTPVSIENFNDNPSNYLSKASGEWNYDELVFGFWDCNASKDLSAKSVSVVNEYLADGGAAIFGHDTLTKAGCGSHKNFNTLAKYVNMELGGWHSYPTSTNVKIVKKGVFTEYPWKIGEVGDSLTIPRSHVYGQIAKGDIWITFDTSGVDADKIYLSTYGNNAFIQTGHSSGQATADEQKIIANIIFYMVAKQYVND